VGWGAVSEEEWAHHSAARRVCGREPSKAPSLVRTKGTPRATQWGAASADKLEAAWVVVTDEMLGAAMVAAKGAE